ncbi:hypothetical protein SO694_00124084 [Aureococcus anophagefferens]|uniref:Uncharacterized protein n=1 Tax=Aureococcus anophagefferens TaxID=44056 RepID=A0ABR1G3T4_AURAN
MVFTWCSCAEAWQPAAAARRRLAQYRGVSAAPSADEDGMARRRVRARARQAASNAVSTLERLYGKPPPYGDLNAAETRELYLSLLPLLADPLRQRNPRSSSRAARKRRESAARLYRETRKTGDLEDLKSRATAAPQRRAAKESEIPNFKGSDLGHFSLVARRAAKRYARERSLLPLRCLAEVLDGTREYARSGRWFLPYGATTEELVERYVDAAVAAAAWEGLQGPDDVSRAAYETVLRKSCETNELLDALLIQSAAGKTAAAADDDGDRAEQFWTRSPLRPAVLFKAVGKAADDGGAPAEGAFDDTDAVWDAFLLRCVAGETADAPGKAGLLAADRAGLLVAPISRARWSARWASRAVRRRFRDAHHDAHRDGPADDDAPDFGPFVGDLANSR